LDGTGLSGTLPERIVELTTLSTLCVPIICTENPTPKQVMRDQQTFTACVG
jgi:hypothetical protein